MRALSVVSVVSKFRLRHPHFNPIAHAYHEAGHIVVARHHGITVFTAQIHRATEKFGIGGYAEIRLLSPLCLNRWRIRAYIDMYVAGQAADELVTYGRKSARYRSDRRYALRHIFDLLASFGNEDPSYKQVNAEFARGRHRSRVILSKKRALLDRVARLLVSGQKISRLPRYYETK